MYKKTFSILIAVISISLLLSSACFAVSAEDIAKAGAEKTAQASGLIKYPKDITAITGNVIGAGLSMVAIVFFGLMIYGGFLWMTARGNEEQAKKALNAIIAAIIGLIVVIAAYAITNFVFKSVGGGETAGAGTSALCVRDDSKQNEVESLCSGKTDAGDCLLAGYCYWHTTCSVNTTLWDAECISKSQAQCTDKCKWQSQ